MPTFDGKELYNCLKKLVEVDKSWYDFPEGKRNLMYIRLCHISTDEILGVRSPRKTKLFAIMTPNPIVLKDRKVKCAINVNKNWPLGHGAFRISGNFGPLIPTVRDARSNGFDDVLWLIDDFVKELSIMNIFFLW